MLPKHAFQESELKSFPVNVRARLFPPLLTLIPSGWLLWVVADYSAGEVGQDHGRFRAFPARVMIVLCDVVATANRSDWAIKRGLHSVRTFRCHKGNHNSITKAHGVAMVSTSGAWSLASCNQRKAQQQG